MWERWPTDTDNPKPLRYFPVLADIDQVLHTIKVSISTSKLTLTPQICTQEHPLIIEAWFRLDPRIAWEDITMRMQRHGRPKQNSLNMHLCRTWRPQYTMLSWRFLGHLLMSRPCREIWDALSPAQKANNTTRGSTPGLINPAMGLQSPAVPLPDMTADSGFVRMILPPKNHQGPTCTIGQRLPQTKRPLIVSRYRFSQRGIRTAADSKLETPSQQPQKRRRLNEGLANTNSVLLGCISSGLSTSEQSDIGGTGETNGSDDSPVTRHAHSPKTSTLQSRCGTRSLATASSFLFLYTPYSRPQTEPTHNQIRYPYESSSFTTSSSLHQPFPRASSVMTVEDVNRMKSGNEWITARGLPPLPDPPGDVRRHRARARQSQEQQDLAIEAASYMSQHSRPGAHGSIPNERRGRAWLMRF